MAESSVKSNYEMFLDTVNTLKSSQGFYSRLARQLSEMSMTEKKNLKDYLNNQPQFKDQVDVVMFLEG